MLLRTEWIGEGEMSELFEKEFGLFNAHQESLKSFEGYFKFLPRLRFLWSPQMFWKKEKSWEFLQSKSTFLRRIGPALLGSGWVWDGNLPDVRWPG